MDLNQKKTDKKCDIIPKILNTGTIKMSNFDGQSNEITCSYYLMPKYDMNLKEYLGQLKGLDKLQQIFEVTR